jgi:hypothetical protein
MNNYQIYSSISNIEGNIRVSRSKNSCNKNKDKDKHKDKDSNKDRERKAEQYGMFEISKNRKS